MVSIARKRIFATRQSIAQAVDKNHHSPSCLATITFMISLVPA